MEIQVVPQKSTAEEFSFEWPHHSISSTDSKVRTTLHDFIQSTLSLNRPLPVSDHFVNNHFVSQSIFL